MIHMKKIMHHLKYTLALLFAFSSCTIDEVLDPNNPSLEGVLINASKAELQSLVTGLEARHRVYFDNATEMFGSFGREVSPFFASDPRFTSDWLGDGGPETYPDFFGSAGSYLSPYIAVKQANILISSVENTNSVSAQEAAGYIGFAKTIKAYQLIWPLMQQYQNGIRIDVADVFNPGPFLDYQDALQEIRDLLDEAETDLAAAGSEFDFSLKMGFATPTEMLQVNRAIAARLALYAGDYDDALTALGDSFMNLAASNAEDLNVGPVHVYGNSPDLSNPLFYVKDQSTSTILIVHPAVIEDLEPGDERASKFFQRTNLVSNSGIPFQGEYQDNRWASNTSSIPFIRNEELILIYAEAQIFATTGTNDEAENAINIIRSIWGLPDYDATGQTDDEILEEILHQRRYSLWAEGGHRWIDLRRTNKLDAAHVDLRDGGSIITQVERPTSETNWDENN
jgi:hypothetical protein